MYFLSNSSKPIDEADVDGTSKATCLGAIIFRLVVEGFLGCGAEIAMRADADLCFQRPAWIEIPRAPPHKGVVKCGYVVILVGTSCPERHLLITDEAAERKITPLIVGITGRNTSAGRVLRRVENRYTPMGCPDRASSPLLCPRERISLR